MTLFKNFSLCLLTTFLLACSGGEPLTKKIFTGETGIAINGYDPVAYFTESKPVKGNAEFSTDWRGATWHFASAKNKAMFDESPESYAPQYGGHCAMATSINKTAPTTPENWQIKDGRLFLNADALAHFLWKNVPGRLEAADKNYSR